MDDSPATRGTRAQIERFRAALADGMPRVGWKFATPGALARLGIDSPVGGWLDGRHSVANGGTIAIPPDTRLAIEAELAVRAEEDGRIAAYAAAFEVIRAARGDETPEEVVAGGLFHYGTVFGEPLATVSWPPAERPRVYLNGELKAEADPARIVADPTAVAKSAAAHLADIGEAMQPGDWLITGSMIVPFGVRPGDAVRAEYGELGTLEVQFA